MCSFYKKRGTDWRSKEKYEVRKNREIFLRANIYRCIVTNDHESTGENVLFMTGEVSVNVYFDSMNNGFEWKRLPCSLMKENAIFLLLAAMAANFFSNIARKVLKFFKEVSQVSRTKRLIFRFITVPAKWIRRARQWEINFYSSKRYDLLWDS